MKSTVVATAIASNTVDRGLPLVLLSAEEAAYARMASAEEEVTTSVCLLTNVLSVSISQ